MHTALCLAILLSEPVTARFGRSAALLELPPPAWLLAFGAVEPAA
jgi:hypothetical protein